MDIQNVVAYVTCFAAVASIFVTLYVFYQQTRADILVYTEHDLDNSTVSVIVENHGGSAAYDVKCSIENIDRMFVLDACKQNKDRGIFNPHGVALLAPRAKRTAMVTAGLVPIKTIRELSSTSFYVNVSYAERNIFRMMKQRKFVQRIEFASLNALYVDSLLSTMSKNHEKIAKQLAKISDALSVSDHR